MKYIKLYETFKEIDIFDEENWNETEPSFFKWLKHYYPNQDN
jgi:hypothetical protein